jgi:hypothetical protein
MAVTVIKPDADIQKALKAIKKVQPELIKQMKKDMRKEAQPAIKSIKDYLLWLDPDVEPFNNTGVSNITKGELIKGRGGKTRWRKSDILRGIRVKFGGPNRKARMGRTQYAIMSIYQANPAGSIYDQAGSKNLGKPGNKFVENLRNEDKPHKDGERKGKKGGSRYMWPGAESHLPKLVIAAERILSGVTTKFNSNYKGF